MRLPWKRLAILSLLASSLRDEQSNKHDKKVTVHEKRLQADGEGAYIKADCEETFSALDLVAGMSGIERREAISHILSLQPNQTLAVALRKGKITGIKGPDFSYGSLSSENDPTQASSASMRRKLERWAVGDGAEGSPSEAQLDALQKLLHEKDINDPRQLTALLDRSEIVAGRKAGLKEVVASFAMATTDHLLPRSGGPVVQGFRNAMRFVASTNLAKHAMPNPYKASSDDATTWHLYLGKSISALQDALPISAEKKWILDKTLAPYLTGRQAARFTLDNTLVQRKQWLDASNLPRTAEHIDQLRAELREPYGRGIGDDVKGLLKTTTSPARWASALFTAAMHPNTLVFGLSNGLRSALRNRLPQEDLEFFHIETLERATTPLAKYLGKMTGGHYTSEKAQERADTLLQRFHRQTPPNEGSQTRSARLAESDDGTAVKRASESSVLILGEKKPPQQEYLSRGERLVAQKATRTQPKAPLHQQRSDPRSSTTRS